MQVGEESEVKSTLQISSPQAQENKISVFSSQGSASSQYGGYYTGLLYEYGTKQA